MKRHISLCALLAALNFYLCNELFAREYIDQTASIEAAYISLTRYILENWRDLTWFPLWYGGIPYQDTYPPLLHLMSAGMSALLQVPPGLGYHITIGLFYCLGPVMLYWLALRLSGSTLTAFVAGLIYSVFSPSAVLVPAIYRDLGQQFVGRRFQTLAAWGEGPHVTALTFLPLALLLLHYALEKRRPTWDFAAAAAMAAVALTNWLACFTLAVGVVCLIARPRHILRTAAIGITAYCLAAPWIPPSTIRTVQTNAKVIGGDYSNVYMMLPLRAALAILLLLSIRWLFRRMGLSLHVQFAILFTTILATITLAAEWFHINLVPQPERYHLQMEMGICLLMAMALAGTLRKSPHMVTVGVVAALALLCIYPVKQIRRSARYSYLRVIDMKTTPMYKLGHWLNEHHVQDRIFAPGAKTFWLNAFTDTPQFDGGFAQGLNNQMDRVGWYAINMNSDPALVLLWLRALGIHLVVGTGPNSTDPYKPLNNPEKLSGMEVLWRDGDETLYRVPHRSTSLARVIPAKAEVIGEPTGPDPLRTYVDALESPILPPATFAWTSRHSAHIHADLEPGHILSVQTTYHPGWHTSSGSVREDGMGQMIIDPQCVGSCEIDLTYDGGLEMAIARWLPWLALVITALRIVGMRR